MFSDSRAAKLGMENIPQYLCKILFYIFIVKQIQFLCTPRFLSGIVYYVQIRVVIFICAIFYMRTFF